jgi:hypothetical protein
LIGSLVVVIVVYFVIRKYGRIGERGQAAT